MKTMIILIVPKPTKFILVNPSFMLKVIHEWKFWVNNNLRSTFFVEKCYMTEQWRTPLQEIPENRSRLNNHWIKKIGHFFCINKILAKTFGEKNFSEVKIFRVKNFSGQNCWNQKIWSKFWVKIFFRFVLFCLVRSHTKQVRLNRATLELH